jgi:protein phosphatase
VITRCLGGDASSVPDLWSFPIVGRERFLVCSDGLTTEVRDEIIAQLLEQHEDPQAAAGALVERALAEGGRDNVSVVVVNLAAH